MTPMKPATTGEEVGQIQPIAAAVPKLNEETLKNLPVPPKGNRITYFAGQVLQGAKAPQGFGVRVTAGGARSFILNYRLDGVEHRFTIGKLKQSVDGGGWSALAAIRHANELRKRIDLADDPLEERRARRVRAVAGKTVNDVLDDHISRYLKKNGLRSADEIEKTFKRHVRPQIGKLGISELKRSDIVAMLDKIEDGSGPVAADRTLAYLRKALNWYAARDDEFNSPIVKGMAKTKPKERAGTRTLDDAEIRDVWSALDAVDQPAPYRAFVRMLLLTAQRRDDVAKMQWSEIAEGSDGKKLWVIPAERFKTKVDNVVPLTDPVLLLIGKRAKGSGPFVFSTTKGKRSFSGYSKAKAMLDTKIAERREATKREPIPGWRQHDLRRTARSLMSRAGVDGNIAERVLGHVIGGVRGVYDRYAYVDEKRAALEKLAAMVELILKPPTGNVERLAPRRRRA